MNTVAVGPIGSAGHESVAGPVIIERDGESFQRNEKDSAFLPSSPPSCSCLPLSPLEVSAPLSRNTYLGRSGAAEAAKIRKRPHFGVSYYREQNSLIRSRLCEEIVISCVGGEKSTRTQTNRRI